jgi:YebC/PmpR family DNA-binding regulatory protein
MGRHFEVRKVAMAKTAAAKSKVFSKFGREIYMAAKNGVPDPELNDTLKRIIEKAKREQVTADLIKRAIDKAKGGGTENYSAIKYEAFGPGNVALIIDCLSDNPNRTITDVRTSVVKTGGKMGISGSVIHNFEYCSVFAFKGYKEDEVLEALIDDLLDIDEVETQDDIVTIYGKQSQYGEIRDSLVKHFPKIVFEVDEITYIPLNETNLEPADQEKFERLLSLLNEIDDVQEIYHNAILKEEEES